ncbi:hypothetical protein C9I57_13535 [Trinickia symbiotica]|uniref:Uncharacterized protein n=2 Tax=Trinickia symbiotica TaxID=863227 RepID=A0A2T3XUD6_9BURK|nr:hypothetical protein C9I57_13535 [Trinickia symbiotica]
MAVSIALTAGAGWYISRALDAGINSYLYISLDANSAAPGAAADTTQAQRFDGHAAQAKSAHTAAAVSPAIQRTDPIEAAPTAQRDARDP